MHAMFGLGLVVACLRLAGLALGQGLCGSTGCVTFWGPTLDNAAARQRTGHDGLQRSTHQDGVDTAQGRPGLDWRLLALGRLGLGLGHGCLYPALRIADARSGEDLNRLPGIRAPKGHALQLLPAWRARSASQALVSAAQWGA